jgi:hypothetical protein
MIAVLMALGVGLAEVEGARSRRTVAGNQAPSGMFKVTLNGFSVLHESSDDPLEGDGRRDEVYIVAEVWVFDRNGQSTFRRSLRSAIMGDPTNRPERVPAGSAQPGIFGGQVGGLRTGDSFPTREPWRRASAITGNNDRAPMKLWEGELVQGHNVVAIMPTVWEWDSNGISETERSWITSVEAWLSGFHGPVFSEGLFRHFGLADNRGAKPRLTDLITRWQPGVAIVQTFGIIPFALTGSSSDGNRPIGISDSGSQGGFRHHETLTPAVLALTLDSARHATVTSTSDKGLGVFEMTYRDLHLRDRRYVPNPNGGFYRLYVQVERVR